MKSKQEPKSTIDFLKEHREHIERTQPVLKTKWYAVEVTPSKRTPWHDDSGRDWTDVKARVCTDFFETKEEVENFLKFFEPDEGNHFEIRKKNLRQISQWVDY